MQFTIIFAAIATLNMAAASPSQRAHLRALNNLCPGIDSPLCCETDVDGVVDLTCESRKWDFTIQSPVACSVALLSVSSLSNYLRFPPQPRGLRRPSPISRRPAPRPV